MNRWVLQLGVIGVFLRAAALSAALKSRSERSPTEMVKFGCMCLATGGGGALGGGSGGGVGKDGGIGACDLGTCWVRFGMDLDMGFGLTGAGMGTCSEDCEG